jgi:mannosyltransferase
VTARVLAADTAPARSSPERPSRAGLSDLWLPAVVAALAVVVSAPRLTTRPVWLDEAYTVGASGDLVTAWRRTGATQALYYLVIWPVTQLSTDRLWLRLPSLLFAVAAVAVVAEIGRRLGGRRMGLFAGSLMALSWALSRFAIEARSYTLALLLVSVSWLGLVAAVQSSAESESERRRWWTVFVVAALAAPLAHGLAVLHVGSQLVALALAPDGRRWLRRCLPLLGGLAIEGVLLFTLGAGEVADWVAPLNAHQLRAILHVLAGRDRPGQVIAAVAVVGAVVAVVALVRRPRAESWPALVPVLWALGAPAALLAMSLLRPYGEARYLLGAMPGVALLVGGLLARLRPTVLAVACWVPLVCLSLQGHDVVTHGQIEDWSAVAAHVADDGHDGDRLLMPDKLRSAFDYAWQRQDDRPRLVPLSPTDPLGEVRRFYDDAPGSPRDALLTGSPETTWYVDRDVRRLDDVERLVGDPAVTRRYEVTGPVEIDDELYVVRFEPRS